MKPPSKIIALAAGFHGIQFAAKAVLLSLLSLSGVMGTKVLGAEPFVELPPLEISADSGVRWRYAEVSGTEVLSCCSDATTRRFIEAEQKLTELLAVALPREFQVRYSVPKIILLSDMRTTAARARELIQGNPTNEERNVVSKMDFGVNLKIDLRDSGIPTSNVRFLPNLRLDDQDCIATFALLNEEEFTNTTLGLTTSHIRMILERRTPPLPAWLIEGAVELFPTMDFKGNSVILSPYQWCSEEESTALKRDPDYPRSLSPMREIFEVGSFGGKPDSTSETSAIWRAQVALFLRWALDPSHGDSNTKFWSLVNRACDGPINEAVFKDCFGFGYADMRDRLSDYLPTALKHPFSLKLTKVYNAPAIRIAPATPADIARIKGGWERLEVNYVKARYPQFVPRYLSQARQTLRHAISRGERDARLLAVAGLFECDVGDDAAAKPLIEAAVVAKVDRPRIYFELSRIRFLEAIKSLEGQNDRLSVEQANEILQPLAVTRRQAPPLPGVYILAAQVWARSKISLNSAQLDLLDEGVRFFPRNISVLYYTALIYGLQGRDEKAASLTSQGLALVLDGPARQRFLQLRAEIESQRRPST